MTKDIFRDVVPPHKRTIRDIPLNAEHEKKTATIHKDIHKETHQDVQRGAGIHQAFNEDEDENVAPISYDDKKRSLPRKTGRKNKIIWLFLAFFFVALFFVLPSIFAGAEVILTPKQEEMEFSGNFRAIPETVDIDQNGVMFKTLTIESEGFRTTTNVQEKDVDKKASGQIVVYNDYDGEPQKLVKNTRFQTSDGKIFRILKSITVPGKTGSNPGSVEVTAYADVPGEEYNVGLVDFTIPGFEGSDRFSKFYARSKTPMAGGYSGMMKIVDSDELENLQKEIHSDLEKDLMSKVNSQVPEGYILYNDGVFIAYESGADSDLGDSVQVTEKGILTAVIFDKRTLGGYVAKNVLVGIGNDMVEILNLEDLTFKIADRNNVNLSEGFDFSLEGSANFVWTFDEEKLKKDFAGQPKKSANTILANYSGISEAEVVLKPFWKMQFPENVNKIKITRVLEK